MSGEVVLEIRTHPDKGRGWFENPRFWRTSFVVINLDLIAKTVDTLHFLLRAAASRNVRKKEFMQHSHII